MNYRFDQTNKLMETGGWNKFELIWGPVMLTSEPFSCSTWRNWQFSISGRKRRLATPPSGHRKFFFFCRWNYGKYKRAASYCHFVEEEKICIMHLWQTTERKFKLPIDSSRNALQLIYWVRDDHTRRLSVKLKKNECNRWRHLLADLSFSGICGRTLDRIQLDRKDCSWSTQRPIEWYMFQ